jgi:polar amino acid transport system substrate-binding protein
MPTMRLTVSKTSRTAVLLAASALALTACGSGSSSDGGTEAAGNELGLVTPGTLTVCSDIPYPPFEFEKDGEYTGFDIEIVGEVAKGLELDLEIKDVGFDGLQSGVVLSAGQCDMGASAITITEERKQNLAFTEPYYDSLQSLLVPADSDVKSIEDLAGKSVGVQQGTTGEKYTRENVPADTEVRAYPSDAELFPALQSGGVDAVLQDLPVNLGHLEGGKYEVVQEFETDEQYGFAMKKEGSEALLEAVNGQLTGIRDSGKYQEIYDKYFEQ